jgi:hypothetical protein
MNTKTLTLLAGATAVVIGAALYMNASRKTVTIEARNESIANAPRLFPELEGRASQVSKITLMQGESSLEMTKVGAEWVMSSKSGFPVRTKTVSDLVSWLSQTQSIQDKTAREELYSKLGVEDPAKIDAKSTLVTLFDGNGVTLAALVVGNLNGANRYARRPDQKQSFVASGTADITVTPLSWIESKIISLESARLASTSFRVIREGVSDPIVTIINRVDPADNKFELQNIPEGRKPKDEFAAARAAQCLAFANFEDVRPVGEVDFSVPTASTAEFKTLDHLVIRTITVQADGKEWTKFAASYESPGAQTATPNQPKPNAGASVEDQPAAAEQPAEDPKAEEVRKEVEELNKLFSKWAFVLPSFTLERLKTTSEDLLAPVEVPGVPAAAPQ